MILVNQQRLWDSLMEMATIGATARGGSCRLALSTDEVLGRQRFIRWCEEAGCEIRIDPIGVVCAPAIESGAIGGKLFDFEPVAPREVDSPVLAIDLAVRQTIMQRWTRLD